MTQQSTSTSTPSSNPHPFDDKCLETLRTRGVVILPPFISNPNLQALQSFCSQHFFNRSQSKPLYAHYSIGRFHYNGLQNAKFCDSVMKPFSPFLNFSKSYLDDAQIFQSELQLLVASPSSINQPFHFDNTSKGLTFIIPLVDITLTNGSTNIIQGSHTYVDLLHSSDYAGLFTKTLNFLTSPHTDASPVALNPQIKAGSCIIFDSRTIHRGCFNASDEHRPIIVIRYDKVDTPPPKAEGSLVVFGVKILGGFLNLVSSKE